MVQVRKQAPHHVHGRDIDLPEWVAHLAISLDESESETLLRACARAQLAADAPGVSPFRTRLSRETQPLPDHW